MKKALGIILSAMFLLSALAGCAGNSSDEEYIGPTIPVYIAEEIANYDPAYGNLDAETQKILGLVYEGLFKYDANGKVVKAQAKSVKILDKPSDNYYGIEIKLQDTAWSDGTPVQAQDYIYAWQRILEPGFRGEAASLLFGIKNARACNQGECSIEDLGVTDSGVKILRITFEGPTDYDKFYEYLASPMLVPLREIAVNKVEKDWSSSSSVVVCNGPFCIRSYSNEEKRLTIDRNIYYMRNVEKDSVMKYVTPYRLTNDLSKGAEGAEELFSSGMLAFDSSLPLSKRAEYASKATVNDTMSVMTYVFNTAVEPFDKPEVRLALSKALDRNRIAEILTFAKPAGGIIADGVFNTNYKGKTSFRSAGGSLIPAEANVAEAKSLLSKAGVSGGSIEITVRKTEADVAVAEYVKSVWDSLGFKVTIKKLDFYKYKDEREYDLVSDRFNEAYESRDFQVISVDYMMFTTDAFGNLATFSKNFASGVIDLTVAADSYDLTTHVSGYDNEQYTAKLEEAFAESDLSKRAELLHAAEEILMNDMPVMPLVQLQTASVSDSNLKNVKFTRFGCADFIKADLKNKDKYTVGTGDLKNKDKYTVETITVE
ncbi:MAG: peptide ABC transporter substrate-binding protein [Clostridia bacterium]|nr:peptide ABC transporter substrate-binding protein [Clostridia bacterium]